MAIKKVLKDSQGRKVYPITSSECVFTPDGKSIESLVSEDKSQIEQNTSDIADLGSEVGNVKTEVASKAADTPSGDPCHYLYVDAGAEYNATDADITKTAPWGESVLHKAGMWYLNGLGDLTTEQIRYIYSKSSDFGRNGNLNETFLGITDTRFRTNFFNSNNTSFGGYISNNTNATFLNCRNIEIAKISVDNNNNSYCLSSSIANMFQNCENLRHIVGMIRLPVNGTYNDSGIFTGCKSLVSVRIFRLNKSINFSLCKELNVSSVLYMVSNALTSPLSILLHPDAYARAMADASVQAALAAHTNVTLVSE